MVLADTYECPDCAYVFDELKSSALSQATSQAELKSASLEQECQGCGAMVRVGLVRCWNCNAFMRADVERRYKQLSSTPQKIIFSDIPADQRTDYLPTRLAAVIEKVAASRDGAEDQFTLGTGVTTTVSPNGDSAFELQQQSARKAAVPENEQSADRPLSKTPELKTPPARTSSSKSAPSADPVSEKPDEKATADGKSTPAQDGDDLLSIAMAEQSEAGQRKGKGGTQTQVMIPCPSCSGLVPVSEKMAGRRTRCPSCRKVMVVPAFKSAPAVKAKKKRPASAGNQTARPAIQVTWLNDAWLHVFSPTSLVLKPGSMESNHSVVDVAVTDKGVFLVTYVKDNPKAKKPAAADKAEGGMLAFVRAKLAGLLGGGKGTAAEAANDLKEKWKKVREHVAKTGEFKNLPNAEVQAISREVVEQIKLVQPISRATESMFAGVPVFGDGRIVVFLPVNSGDDKQSFLSLPISRFRVFADKMKTLLNMELPAAENNIPLADRNEPLMCFYNQSRFEATAQTIFYQKDSDYQLTVVGHRCANCGITVSEEGRSKNKLGGANGKGIAKAKCPKCGSKFGSVPLYKIAAGPSAEPDATGSN